MSLFFFLILPLFYRLRQISLMFFLVHLKTQKGHFEINWPLELGLFCRLMLKSTQKKHILVKNCVQHVNCNITSVICYCISIVLLRNRK